MKERVVALVSGLDSLSYLATYLGKAEIEAFIIDYGQRARQQIIKTEEILNKLEGDKLLKRRTIKMDFMNVLWSGYQRTDANLYLPNFYRAEDLIMPYQLALFILIAATRARTWSASKISIGLTTDDRQKWNVSNMPIFPETGNGYFTALQFILDRGHLWWLSDQRTEVWSPLREEKSKKANLIRGFAILGDSLFSTWSCYDNNDQHCGICFGCKERIRVFKEAGIPDKTNYEV